MHADVFSVDKNGSHIIYCAEIQHHALAIFFHGKLLFIETFGNKIGVADAGKFTFGAVRHINFLPRTIIEAE